MASYILYAGRAAVEAFGQRMERWFSPDPSSGAASASASSDGAWSRGSTAAGQMAQLAQLAAQHRAAAVAQHGTSSAAVPAGLGPEAQHAVGFASDFCVSASQTGSVAPSPASTEAGTVPHLPLSTGLAPGRGELLPGSWFSAGGHNSYYPAKRSSFWRSNRQI